MNERRYGVYKTLEKYSLQTQARTISLFRNRCTKSRRHTAFTKIERLRVKKAGLVTENKVLFQIDQMCVHPFLRTKQRDVPTIVSESTQSS